MAAEECARDKSGAAAESDAQPETTSRAEDEATIARWVDDLVTRYPRLGTCESDIRVAGELLLGAARTGHTIFTCGNGGSYSDSQHIVGELMKRFHKSRPLAESRVCALREATGEEGEALARQLEAAIPAIVLGSQGALLTAFANDVNPDLIFAQELEGYGHEGDVLLALSSSGSSKNVWYAAQVARSKGMGVVLLTGASGGSVSKLASCSVRVPETDTYKVQDLHLPIYHTLCLALEDALF